MTSYLNSLDFVSKDVRVYLNGRSKLASLPGGIISCLIVILYCIACFYFGRELILREDPISRVDSRKIEKAKVALDSFPVAFSVFGRSQKDFLVDPRFLTTYSFQTTLISIRNTQNTTIFTGKIVKCAADKTNFTKNLAEVKPHLTKFCLDFSNPTLFLGDKEAEVVINKPYGYDESSHLNLLITRCNGPNCLDKAEFGEIFVTIYTQDSSIELADYGKPLKENIAQRTSSFDGVLKTRHFTEIKFNKLLTDSGWLTESLSQEEWLSPGSETIEVAQVDPNWPVQAVFSFTSSLNQRVYHRCYLRLQELLARLGGFSKALMLFSKGIMASYSDFILYNQIYSKPVKKMQRNLTDTQKLSVIQESKQSFNLKSKSEVNNNQISFWTYILAKMSKSNRTINNIDFNIIKQRLDLRALISINDSANNQIIEGSRTVR